MFNEIFSFKGRINRSKFWTIQIFIGLFLLAVYLFDTVIFGENAGIMYLVGVLLILIPSLANQVKRWHDRDKSGYWVLIALIPLIGSIWVFVETGFLKGTDGPNRFGADPLDPNQIIEKQPDDYI